MASVASERLFEPVLLGNNLGLFFNLKKVERRAGVQWKEIGIPPTPMPIVSGDNFSLFFSPKGEHPVIERSTGSLIRVLGRSDCVTIQVTELAGKKIHEYTVGLPGNPSILDVPLVGQKPIFSIEYVGDQWNADLYRLVADELNKDIVSYFSRETQILNDLLPRGRERQLLAVSVPGSIRAQNQSSHHNSTFNYVGNGFVGLYTESVGGVAQIRSDLIMLEKRTNLVRSHSLGSISREALSRYSPEEIFRNILIYLHQMSQINSINWSRANGLGYLEPQRMFRDFLLAECSNASLAHYQAHAAEYYEMGQALKKWYLLSEKTEV